MTPTDATTALTSVLRLGYEESSTMPATAAPERRVLVGSRPQIRAGELTHGASGRLGDGDGRHTQRSEYDEFVDVLKQEFASKKPCGDLLETMHGTTKKRTDTFEMYEARLKEMASHIKVDSMPTGTLHCQRS